MYRTTAVDRDGVARQCDDKNREDQLDEAEDEDPARDRHDATLEHVHCRLGQAVGFARLGIWEYGESVCSMVFQA
jgi:hypothetical protein